ncbi:MAG: helix-turn-helix domain-containing protein [Nitrospira sp.]|nr:helix-turn-helix domain-containing protein [Nitrospira sp.]
MIGIDGKAIQIGRALRAWTQRDLSRATGLSLHRVWELENNQRVPTKDELAKILRALSTGE